MLNKTERAQKVMRFTALFLILCCLLPAVCIAAEPDYITHTVVSGDTLGKIAKQYAVTVNEIVELNGITNPNVISVGTELKIPVIAPETTATETTAAETEPIEPVETEPVFSDEISYNNSYLNIFENMSTVLSGVKFENRDIKDVLSAFAMSLGCNIIYKGSDVPVSLDLSNVTVGEALDYVMKLINMTYITDGRTIIVGEKQDLIKSFSEALQITEFSLTYVKASTIMSQISALEISVTVTLSGENEYRFIAQGLPSDLSKVRDLIRMIDKRENSMLDPAAVASFFYTIDLIHITAGDLQSVLASTALPTGIVLPAKPLTLYVYANAEDYKLIMNIAKVVDTKNPEVTVTDAEQPVIKQINLRYVTLDLIESQITANSEVSIIKIATNKSSFWLNGKLAQIKKAEEIILLLDTEKNAAITSQEIKDLFRPVTLKFITAEQFNTILTGLSLPVGLIFPDNAKTLFLYASADEFKAISDIQAVVDKEENNAGTASVFRPVELRYITAEQFNTTLTGLSLPTGIIFPNNEKTLFIFATPEQFDAINDMQRVVDIPTNAADIETLFITVVLRYITAEQFNTTLASLNLPTGIIYSDNENTLYINATYEEEDNINKIKAIVDVPQNNLTAGSKFRYITLRYMTADQFNETLKSMSLPTGLTFPQNQYTLYLNTTASEYRAINDIRMMVDAPQNTLGSGAQFQPVTLRYITAKQFNTVLASVKLPTGTYFKDSDKTMFIYATMDELMSINNIKNTVDTLEGASSTSKDYSSVTLKYITAEQFNSTLKSLSLPAGIIYPDNKYTLYIYATPEEFTSINKIKALVDTADNVSSSAATEFRTVVLKNITAEQFNTTLSSLKLPKGIIFSDNKYTLYIYATPAEFNSINEIKTVVDTPENASATKDEIQKQFYRINLTYISAELFNSTLSNLALPTGIVYPDNKKTIFINATPNEYASINNIKAVVDIAENAKLTSEEIEKQFYRIGLTHITAEKFNSTLKSLSLPTGIVFEDNKKTLFIYTTPAEYDSIIGIKTSVDTAENASSSATKELRPVALSFLTAEQFNTTLKSLSLPTGTIYPDNKKTLYILATQAEFDSIYEIKVIVDTAQNASGSSSKEFRPLTLDNITAELFNITLTSLSLPKGIIYPDNKKTLYIFATPAEFTSIYEIKVIVDTSENASSSVKKEFRPLILDNITGELFNTTLTSLSLPKGIIYPENKKTLYIFATPEEFTSIYEIKVIVDTPQNASSNIPKEFKAYTLSFITAEEFNTTLKSMSLPSGIIIKGNIKTLYITATFDEFVSIDIVKGVVDTPVNYNAPEVIYMLPLQYINKDFAIPFIEALSFNISIIDIKNMQKVIWIKGTQSEIDKVVLRMIDVDKDGAMSLSFIRYKLINISAEEMATKLATLNYTNIKVQTDTLSGLRREIFVSFPNDMQSTIEGILSSLDVTNDRVTLMIDSINGEEGYTNRELRIQLIMEMSGITDRNRFDVSGNISTTATSKYIIYLKYATIEEIKRVREIVAELGG